ncbi:MAG: hypothetical protein WDN30_10880 [Pararobbsia sp.]
MMSITNNLGGTIRGDDGAGINIDGFNANEQVTIVNHGMIIGNGVHGDGDGVDVDGLVNLTNTGTIKSLQAFQDTSEGVTVGGGTIANSGTIEGDNVNGGASRGITLAGLDKDPVSGAAIPTEGIFANTSITNSGLIRGQTGAAIGVTGAANAFTVTITNLAGGVIEGGGTAEAAIFTGGNATTLIDMGTITADTNGKAIDFGSGDSALRILGARGRHQRRHFGRYRHELADDRAGHRQQLQLWGRDLELRERGDRCGHGHAQRRQHVCRYDLRRCGRRAGRRRCRPCGCDDRLGAHERRRGRDAWRLRHRARFCDQRRVRLRSAMRCRLSRRTAAAPSISTATTRARMDA